MAHGENPPLNITPGAIRFNTDSMKLEYFHIGMEGGGTSSYAGIGTVAAGEWVQITTDSPDIQTGGTRALVMGGYNPSGTYLDEIVYINMATTGDSQTFGELTVSDRNHVHSGTSDRTRGISAGGSKAPGVYAEDIEFVTISSTGNAADFNGNLTEARYGLGSGSNGTRGLFAGGNKSPGTGSAVIDYITIQSTGVNAQDFGDLSVAREYIAASMCSSTRAIFAGGRTPTYYNLVEFVTISTQGNAADFGDSLNSMSDHKGGITSNSIRGINMGGYLHPAYTNTIEYYTLTTLGNATDFGDLTVAGAQAGGAASPTRCVKMGQGSPTYTNTIEYVQIMTLGDAVDFGYLNGQVVGYSAACSNGHGGLG